MKKILLYTSIIVFALFTLSGCTSKADIKKEISTTKADIEETNKDMFLFGRKYSAESYGDSFILHGREILIKDEKSNDVYIKYEKGEENNMPIGADKNDSKKYHIYIGSKKYKDLWSYATIDLDTGNITWQDNY